MALTPDDVAALARLARIELTDDELAHLAPQLDVILESVTQVADVAAEDIPPTSHALPLTNVFRDDVVRPSLPRGRRAGRRSGRRAGPLPGAPDPRGGSVSELIHRDAADLAAAIAARETSAVEVTQAHLDRIAAVDETVHAFLYVDAERALAQAAAVDAKIAAGEPVGPLAGVPLALKDVLHLLRRPHDLRLEDPRRAGSRRTTRR